MATRTPNTPGKGRAVHLSINGHSAQIIPIADGWRFPPQPTAEDARQDEMIELVAGLLPDQVIPCAFGLMSEIVSGNEMSEDDKLDRINLVRLCASRVLIQEGRL